MRASAFALLAGAARCVACASAARRRRRARRRTRSATAATATRREPDAGPPPSGPRPRARPRPTSPGALDRRHGDRDRELRRMPRGRGRAVALERARVRLVQQPDLPRRRRPLPRRRRARTRAASAAGCHDVALLVDGAMSGEVGPRRLRARHGGITCRVCHGIEDARARRQRQLRARASPIPVPRDGDDESLRAHKARMALAPAANGADVRHVPSLVPLAGDGQRRAPRRGRTSSGRGSGRPTRAASAARIDEPVDGSRVPHLPHAARGRAPRGTPPRRTGRSARTASPGANTWLAGDARRRGAGRGACRAMLRGAASIDVAVAVGRPTGRARCPPTARRSRPVEPLDARRRGPQRARGAPLPRRRARRAGHVDRGRGARRSAAGSWPRRGLDRRPPARTARRTCCAPCRRTSTGRRCSCARRNRFRAPVFDHTIAPRDAEVAALPVRRPREARRRDSCRCA